MPQSGRIQRANRNGRGLGNTAADIASDLVGLAGRVYISHRYGNYVFARWCKGKPLDMFSNRRAATILYSIEALAPERSRKLIESFAEKGSIVSIPGLSSFSHDGQAERADGSGIDVDVIIFCTGYRADYSIMPLVKASSEERPSAKEMEDPPNAPLTRLYKNIFSPSHPDSIAYHTNWALGVGIMTIGDLAAMAITQVWQGTFCLPSQERMNIEIDAHHSWLKSLAGPESARPETINEGLWIKWLNDAAGTRVNDNLGYGLHGWWYWMCQPSFCNLLMGGVDSPHVMRLFDGRLKLARS